MGEWWSVIDFGFVYGGERLAVCHYRTNPDDKAIEDKVTPEPI
jgi:hypothetical protein